MKIYKFKYKYKLPLFCLSFFIIIAQYSRQTYASAVLRKKVCLSHSVCVCLLVADGQRNPSHLEVCKIFFYVEGDKSQKQLGSDFAF